ncbi:Reticulon-like protein [Drosera capensis]
MDSTPPSHKSEPTHLQKSASRFARMTNITPGSETDQSQTPHFSVNFVDEDSSLPTRKTPSSNVSVTLKDLLVLSPFPMRRSRARLTDRIEMGDDLGESVGSRRRCKARIGLNGLLGCASPRSSGRRLRRRVEQDGREDNVDELGKHKKRRNSGKSRKEKLGLVVNLVPSTSALPNERSGDQSSIDHLGQLIGDLIMWRDVAKTSLWFGFGCVCFLSSCFMKELRFSLFSVISQVGLFILVLAFFSNVLSHHRIGRDGPEISNEYKLKEEDVLRVVRVMLPIVNLLMAKLSELFSGEPCMTLKVASFLLIGAEFGHLLTLWRLCVTGFVIGLTVPKLYSLYSTQIDTTVEHWMLRVLETWKSCSHKKTLLASAAAGFWSLTSLKTRVFAAFISLVILRYNRQCSNEQHKEQEEEVKAADDVTQSKALAVMDT